MANLRRPNPGLRPDGSPSGWRGGNGMWSWSGWLVPMHEKVRLGNLDKIETMRVNVNLRDEEY